MEIKNIEDIKKVFKGRIVGFDVDSFVDSIVEEWNAFFVFLENNNLVKTKSDLWSIKGDIYRRFELALVDMRKSIDNSLKELPGETDALTFLIPHFTISNFYFEATAALLLEIVNIKNANAKFGFDQEGEASSGRVFKILGECLDKKSLLFKYYDPHVRNGIAHFRASIHSDPTKKDESEKPLWFIQFYDSNFKPTTKMYARLPIENGVYDYKRRQVLIYPTLLNTIYLLFQFAVIHNLKEK